MSRVLRPAPSPALACLVAVAMTITSCANTDARIRQRAQVDVTRLSAVAPPTQSGPFAVDAMFYHPSLWPFESFVKQIATGNMTAAITNANWRYVPSNADGALISELLDAGYLPALVRVTNTSGAPANMQALALTASLGGQAGPAVPNDELPTAFERINWASVGANVAEAAAMTAVVIGVVGLFFLAIREARRNPAAELALRLLPNIKVTDNVSIGAGGGLLCPGGVPVPYDGVPFSNAEMADFATACWKQAMAVRVPLNFKTDRPSIKVVDLDYQQVLLPYKVLAPGEAAVGLQFFKIPPGVTDWQLASAAAEIPDGAERLAASTLPPATAKVQQAGYFIGQRGAQIELAEMQVGKCGFAKEHGRFTMQFRDTYGESVKSQKLQVTLDTKELPASGSSWDFDANNTNQHVSLYLGPELAELNGEWRSYIGGSTPSHCRMEVQKTGIARGSRRQLVDDKLRFGDEFYVRARVHCIRIADWDVTQKDESLKFTADVVCREPWVD